MTSRLNHFQLITSSAHKLITLYVQMQKSPTENGHLITTKMKQKQLSPVFELIIPTASLSSHITTLHPIIDSHCPRYACTLFPDPALADSGGGGGGGPRPRTLHISH